MKSFIYQLCEVVKKEFAVNFRQRAVFASMLMFTLTAVACVSLAIHGSILDSDLLSALLWIILFFTSSAIEKTFDDEAMETLKIYANPQVILFGKMIYSLLSVVFVTLLMLPVFIILFDCTIGDPLMLVVTILLGLCGISSAGTIIAAISSVASVRSGLFEILLFPVILPLFMPAIELTTKIFSGLTTSMDLIFAMLIYNLILGLASSILFDSLWY